jgi:hypothetical protein
MANFTPKDPYTTKIHNYVLRSKQSLHLLTVMVLMNHGRMRGNTHPRNSYPNMVMVKADGTWAGNAHWACKVLCQHGLIRVAWYTEDDAYPYAYGLTEEGRSCLRGALEVREDFDPVKALLDLDATKVWG